MKQKNKQVHLLSLAQRKRAVQAFCCPYANVCADLCRSTLRSIEELEHLLAYDLQPRFCLWLAKKGVRLATEALREYIEEGLAHYCGSQTEPTSVNRNSVFETFTREWEVFEKEAAVGPSDTLTRTEGTQVVLDTLHAQYAGYGFQRGRHRLIWSQSELKVEVVVEQLPAICGLMVAYYIPQFKVILPLSDPLFFGQGILSFRNRELFANRSHELIESAAELWPTIFAGLNRGYGSAKDQLEIEQQDQMED